MAKVDPDLFSICAMTTDGRIFEVGDFNQLFTIQSISKVFVYGLAFRLGAKAYRELLDHQVGFTAAQINPAEKQLGDAFLDGYAQLDPDGYHCWRHERKLYYGMAPEAVDKRVKST